MRKNELVKFEALLFALCEMQYSLIINYLVGRDNIIHTSRLFDPKNPVFANMNLEYPQINRSDIP